MGQENDFLLLRTILKLVGERECPTTLCRSIIVSFEFDQLLSLFEFVLTDALQDNGLSEQTVLRLDSPATALVTCFLHRWADRFLLEACRPTVMAILRRSQVLELNPQREEDAETRERSTSRVKAHVEGFLSNVRESLFLLPNQVRDILRLIWRCCNRHYPGTGTTIVGSFLFLRFLCPGVTFPDKQGVFTGEVNLVQRKNLVLITKIVHNVVNNVEFDGSKEQYLGSLNSLIQANHLLIREDIQQIVCNVEMDPPQKDLMSQLRARSKSSSKVDAICLFNEMTTPAEAYMCIGRYYFDYALPAYELIQDECTRAKILEILPTLLHPRSKNSPTFGSLRSTTSRSHPNVKTRKFNLSEVYHI